VSGKNLTREERAREELVERVAKVMERFDNQFWSELAFAFAFEEGQVKLIVEKVTRQPGYLVARTPYGRVERVLEYVPPWELQLRREWSWKIPAQDLVRYVESEYSWRLGKLIDVKAVRTTVTRVRAR
jgi:hypothetical protein